MPRKPKFKPVITRVKLNPEQAVLVCDCYNNGYGHVPEWDRDPRYWPISYFSICRYGYGVKQLEDSNQVILGASSS